MKKSLWTTLILILTTDWSKIPISAISVMPYHFQKLDDFGTEDALYFSIFSSLCIKAKIVFWSHPITFAKCTMYDNVLHYLLLLHYIFLDTENTATTDRLYLIQVVLFAYYF